MIQKITIKNFKAHSDTSLELSNLNILTGINGVGKSSIFQALLLLRQSQEYSVLKRGLQLNKPYCFIGSIEDAIYQYAGNEPIEFGVQNSEGNNLVWHFSTVKNDLTGDFIPLIGNSPSDINGLSIFSDNFHYIAASRVTKNESNTFAVESRRQLSIERGQTELVAQFLYYYGKEKKEEIKFRDLRHPTNSENDLLSQTTAWEREICPDLNIIPIRSGNSYTIKYSFNKKGDVTNEFSSDNVGFGIGYSLPIIVAALSSGENSLILVENPEAHLHPRGQSEISRLLALAAHCGIQIILETHSEHIINSVLVACKKFENGEKGINKDLVRIYHFKRDEEKHCAIAESIKVLPDGKVDRQPEDFFEQTEKDLNYLLGF
jgi:predicted ATPase